MESKDYLQLYVGNPTPSLWWDVIIQALPSCVFFPQNGLLSALPYLGCSVTAVLSGQLADYLRESCNYPTAGVRKAFTLVGEASTPSSNE